MNRLSAKIERILPLIKNIFVPAGLFGTALIAFYGWDSASAATLKALHYAFYLAGFASFMILLYFNRRRPAFYVLLMILSYIIINRLKTVFGSDYNTTAYYINLCFFLPANLLAFYFIPDNRLLIKMNIFLLLGIFIQFSIGELSGQAGIKISLGSFEGYFEYISMLGAVLFIVTLSVFFIKASQSGTILDYASFFYTLNLFFGILYSANPTALAFFFGSAALTLLSGIILNLRYNIRKDVLTGLPGRYSYMINSASFPLKYSIGVISIDNYAQMQNMFGRRDRDMLVRMIASKITDEESDENLYRYNEDEFILIFKNENKNESFEHLEKVRRAIASAEFILSHRRKSIKITVSTCVSEKKRSDANSMEVLYRIRKTLQKANEFSYNVSSKA